MDRQFNLKILPEFNGTGSIVECLEKLELVRDLSEIKCLDRVIPLCLTRGAFAVYQHLTKDEKSDMARIKEALMTAFAVNKFTAYEQFEACVLRPGEIVDVYLVDLQKLLILFGGMLDSVMACVFMWGLPGHVERLLTSSARMDHLSLE